MGLFLLPDLSVERVSGEKYIRIKIEITKTGKRLEHKAVALNQNYILNIQTSF
jgi:hypothetical protein